MGAADVVPGVSGGTIAFITGIYDTLLESIRRINPRLWPLFRQHGLVAVWQHINGNFLVALGLGILTSILSFARLISYLLVHHPIPLWSFFTGLILISILHILKQVKAWHTTSIIALVIGAVLAWSMTVLHPVQLPENNLSFFIGGAIAICAMILPGISGSFILLLLGLYATVINAVKAFDFGIIAVFAMGCLVGLLSFSHLLSWLLRKHRNLTLCFLTGLMAGTLPKLWPWKLADSQGVLLNVLPSTYSQAMQVNSQWLLAIGTALFGIAAVWLLEKVSKSDPA